MGNVASFTILALLPLDPADSQLRLMCYVT